MGVFGRALFDRRFVKLFSGMLHSWDWFLGQDFHQNILISHMELQHSYGIGMFFLIKRPNYPYYHPLSSTAGYPPLPPSAAGPPLDHCQLPSSIAGPLFATILHQGYFWKCAKYSLEFNPSTKCSKKHISEKAILEDSIPKNPISGNENSNLLPNTPVKPKHKYWHWHEHTTQDTTWHRYKGHTKV